MERLPSGDQAPKPISVEQRLDFFRGAVDLTRLGKERADDDGRTASFQLDSLTELTVRVIHKNGKEYLAGAYVTIEQRMQEYEDGSFFELTREYHLPASKGIDPFVCEFYSYRDEDEEEIVYRPARQALVSDDVWEHTHSEREIWEEEFAGRFVRSNFSPYHFDEVMKLMATASYANMVTSGDDIHEDY